MGLSLETGPVMEVQNDPRPLTQRTSMLTLSLPRKKKNQVWKASFSTPFFPCPGHSSSHSTNGALLCASPVRGLGSWASLTDYTSDLAQGRGPGTPGLGTHRGKKSTLPARS